MCACVGFRICVFVSPFWQFFLPLLIVIPAYYCYCYCRFLIHFNLHKICVYFYCVTQPKGEKQTFSEDALMMTCDPYVCNFQSDDAPHLQTDYSLPKNIWHGKCKPSIAIVIAFTFIPWRFIMTCACLPFPSQWILFFASTSFNRMHKDVFNICWLRSLCLCSAIVSAAFFSFVRIFRSDFVWIECLSKSKIDLLNLTLFQAAEKSKKETEFDSIRQWTYARRMMV